VFHGSIFPIGIPLVQRLQDSSAHTTRQTEKQPGRTFF